MPTYLFSQSIPSIPIIPPAWFPSILGSIVIPGRFLVTNPHQGPAFFISSVSLSVSLLFHTSRSIEQDRIHLLFCNYLPLNRDSDWLRFGWFRHSAKQLGPIAPHSPQLLSNKPSNKQYLACITAARQRSCCCLRPTKTQQIQSTILSSAKYLLHFDRASPATCH